MRLLIMGPPGAGKGTQAQAISDRYGIPAISTGMMFRLNITNRTPLGEQIKRLISNGEFVPDAITEKMLFNRLGEQDVMKRPFNAPRPDTVNTCIDTAWSNPYQGASNYDWQPWPPGQRKPYPRHEQCVGGVKVTMYYASNTQTVRQMKVIANDHYRAMTDAQQLDSAVAKLMEEAVNSVQGTKQAPKL